MATLTDYDLRINTKNADRELAALYNYYNNQFSRKGLNLQINAGSGGISSLNKDLTTFNRNLDVSTSRIVSFAATSSLVFGLVNAFQTLVKDSISVEKSLASIQAITGVSDSSLSKLSDTIFSLANSAGQSFDQASSAFEEFARQGLSATRSIEATSAALTLSRIGATNAATAVKDLTAIMNTFVGSGMDYVDVVDQIIALDNSFAVSAQGISEGLRRVSGVASEAGLSFQETASLITAMQEISARGESVIGNSLKSIFTRVQRPEVLSQLEELGIQTKNADGNFRNLVSILTDLSSVYQTLTDAQRASIGETVAGVYQINAFQSAMKALNPEVGTFAKAMTVAGEASGNAASRLEILNNTTSTSLTILQNNLKQFNSTVGSLTIQPVIDDFTSGINRLLQNFNTLIKADDFQNTGKKVAEGFLKGLGSAISGPGVAALGIILGKLFTKTGKDLLTAFKSLTTLNSSAQTQVQLQQAINQELVRGNKELAVRLGMMQRIASTPLSGSLLGGGGRVRNRAKGLLPAIDREKRAISMGVGGAPSNSKPVVTALKNGGFNELAVVNSSEQIVRKGGKDYVLTKDMQVGNFAIGSVAEEEMKLMNLQYRLQEAESKKISKKVRRQIAIDIGKQERNLTKAIETESRRMKIGSNQSNILKLNIKPKQDIERSIIGTTLEKDPEYQKIRDQLKKKQLSSLERFYSPIDKIAADPKDIAKEQTSSLKKLYGLTNAEISLAKKRQLKAMGENRISPIDMISQSPRIVDYRKFGPTSADFPLPESQEDLRRRMTRRIGGNTNIPSRLDTPPTPPTPTPNSRGIFRKTYDASTKSLSRGRFGGTALGLGFLTPIITDVILQASGKAETEIGKKVSSGASALGSGLTVAGALGFSPLGLGLGAAATAITLWRDSVSNSTGALEEIINKSREGAASLNLVSENATELARLIKETDDLRKTGGPIANIKRNENQIRQLSSELSGPITKLLNDPRLSNDQRIKALGEITSQKNREEQTLSFSANVAASAIEWTKEMGFGLKSLENAASNFIGSMADDVKLSNSSIAALKAGKFGEFLESARGDMVITAEMSESMWKSMEVAVKSLGLSSEEQTAAMYLLERSAAAATYESYKNKDAIDAKNKSLKKSTERTNQLKRAFDSFAGTLGKIAQIENLERSLIARNANELFQQAVRSEPNLSPTRQIQFDAQAKQNEIDQRYNQEIRSLLDKELPEISKSLIEGARNPEEMANVMNKIANYLGNSDIGGLESLLKANNVDNDARNAILRKMESAQVRMAFAVKEANVVKAGDTDLNNKSRDAALTAAQRISSSGVFGLDRSLSGDTKVDSDLIRKNEELIKVRRKELEELNKNSRFVDSNSNRGREIQSRRQSIQAEIERATIESIGARSRLFNIPEREDETALALRTQLMGDFKNSGKGIRNRDTQDFITQEITAAMESIRERTKSTTGNSGTLIGEELMKKILNAMNSQDFSKASNLFEEGVGSRNIFDEKLVDSVNKISDAFKLLKDSLKNIDKSVDLDARKVLGGASPETENAALKAMQAVNDSLVKGLTDSSEQIYKAFSDNIPIFQREIEIFGKDSEYLGRFLKQFSESANLLANSGIKSQVENTINVNVTTDGTYSNEEFEQKMKEFVQKEFPGMFNEMRKRGGEKPINMPPSTPGPYSMGKW